MAQITDTEMRQKWLDASKETKATITRFIESFVHAWDFVERKEDDDDGIHTQWMTAIFQSFCSLQSLPQLSADELLGQLDAWDKEKRTYTFIVDLDERGEYRAHIDNYEGTEVWSINTEALEQAIEDGYLPQGKASTMGEWKAYLEDTGVAWFDAEEPILQNVSGTNKAGK